MLIGNDGAKLGLMPISKALEAAQTKELDLVQVSSNESSPVVCKLMDFGKYIFTKKKKCICIKR